MPTTVHELHQVPHSFVLTLIVDVLPMILGAVYAIRPTEQRLVLMRPLSLAAIFASLGSLVGGLATILQGIAATATLSAGALGRVETGLSLALVPLYFGFGCLTIAWLLVAVGMRRARV